MNCSNCNHHMDQLHSRCPECNFPTNQPIPAQESKAEVIHCNNCGLANESNKVRCVQCNIPLQPSSRSSWTGKTVALKTKSEHRTKNIAHIPFSLNRTQTIQS